MKSWELARLLGRIRERIGESSLLRLQLFCEVAAAGSAGVEQGSLLKDHGVGRSTISVAVHDLTEMTHRKEKGLGLLRIRVDPSNLRVNIVYLTEKGEELAKELFS